MRFTWLVGNAQIDQRIARIDRWARETLSGNLAIDAIVVLILIEEARFGPAWIDCGSTDRVQVELVDVFLPIENVIEILGPESNLSRAGTMEHVVVAMEADGAIVGDIDIVAIFGPKDVVEQFDLSRSAGHSNVVTDRRIERVADNSNIGLALDLDAGRVAIEDVMRNQLAVGCDNPDRVATDSIELDATVELNSSCIRFDDVGVIKIVAHQ